MEMTSSSCSQCNYSEPVQQASKVSLSVMEMTSSSCSLHILYALFYAESAVIFKFDTEVPVSLDAISLAV